MEKQKPVFRRGLIALRMVISVTKSQSDIKFTRPEFTMGRDIAFIFLSKD